MTERRLLDQHPNALERRLLEAGRDVPVPPAGKARLLASLGAGAALGSLGTQAAAKGASWVGGFGSTSIKLAVVSVLGLSGAVAITAEDWSEAVERAQSSRLASIDFASVAREANALGQEENTSWVPVAEADEAKGDRAQSKSAPPVRTRTRAARRRPVDAPSVVTGAEPTQALDEPATTLQLREEAQLVETLRSAVSSADLTLARQLISRHRKAFSHGQLAPEIARLERRLNTMEAQQRRP